MTRQTIERLSYIVAHRLVNLQSQDAAIFGKQYATQGMRRTVHVDRIAEVIAETFDGIEQAELANMMRPERTKVTSK